MSDTSIIRPSPTAGAPASAPLATAVTITDYVLIRMIGGGAFGEVWLAQSRATGRYRAVKIVYKERVPTAHSYETEFAGLKRFEEISRESLGFVDILHISRHDEAGYFYYVMELADDLENGPRIHPETYTCKSLAALLKAQGPLSVSECGRILAVVAEAVADLHRHNLVHRDIKPGNIVFVRGSPKLADIGLVSEASDAAAFTSIIGTPGYLDEASHGKPGGDIYALGKILYVMATGHNACDWPDWARTAGASMKSSELAELSRITSRACHPDRARRYTSADQLLADARELIACPSQRFYHPWRRFARLISRHG